MPPTDRKIKSKIEEGKWVFYDVDLDDVRESLAKDIYLAGRMEPAEFRDRQEFIRLLEEHINRTQNKRPEHGDYLQPYGPAENLGGLDFEKMLPRENFEGQN